MKSIGEIYTESVRENLKPLFANWEPGKPVELGDYGQLDGATFIHIGNVKDLGISFETRYDETKDRKSFSSRGSAEIKFHSKGAAPIKGIASVKAKLEVNFSSEEAVFFNAAECHYFMMKNKSALGREIMKLYERNGKENGLWLLILLKQVEQ